MTSQMRIAVIIYISFLCGFLHANDEKELVWKDGKLLGMYDKFSPASFDLINLSLAIKNKKLVFPTELRKLLMYQPDGDPFGEPSDALWKPHPYTYRFFLLPEHAYSDDDRRPPTIAIIIRSKGAKSYFRLIINIKTLEFIEAEVVVEDIGHVPIDLDGIPDKPAKP